MRVIASSRAWYIACERTSISWFWFHCAALVADVVDRAADHEPERVEARLLDEQELVHGQVAGEEVGGLHLLRAARGRARARLRSKPGCTALPAGRSSGLLVEGECEGHGWWRGSGSASSTIAVPRAWTITIMSVTLRVAAALALAPLRSRARSACRPRRRAARAARPGRARAASPPRGRPGRRCVKSGSSWFCANIQPEFALLAPAGHRVDDRGAGDDPDRPVAARVQLREVLAGEVREHRLVVADLEPLALDGGADGDELDQPARPLVARRARSARRRRRRRRRAGPPRRAGESASRRASCQACVRRVELEDLAARPKP